MACRASSEMFQRWFEMNKKTSTIIVIRLLFIVWSYCIWLLITKYCTHRSNQPKNTTQPNKALKVLIFCLKS